MPTTRDALASLDELGIPVLAATARNRMAVKLAFEQTGIKLPTVLQNGALGVADGEVFHSAVIDPATADAVLMAFDDVGLSPQINVLDNDVIGLRTSDNSSCDSYLDFARPFLRLVDDLATAVKRFPVIQVSVGGVDQEPLEEVKQAIAHLGLRCYLVEERQWLGGGSHTLMIASDQAGKWNGVLAYCKRFDIDPDAVLAVGDDLNDIELLEHAHVSCSMHHSPARVRAVADHVLPESPGWAAILDHF